MTLGVFADVHMPAKILNTLSAKISINAMRTMRKTDETLNAFLDSLEKGKEKGKE